MNSSTLASHEDEIILLNSQDDLEEERGTSAFASGSRSRPIPTPSRPARNNPESEFIDLTGSPEIEIISSNLPSVPRPTKRPRYSPQNKAIRTSVATTTAQAVGRLLPPPPAPPASPPSPRGPKCGICLEAMGGNTDRPMMAGSCGHVYCNSCLLAAVKTTKKCPTCRKTLQARQLHAVYVNF
ncbi:hypothetical protein Ndes2526B_g07970 [Nannochloris sp. 'desiccata']